MGKSAQIPLYVWLPDAMAGPTPVSALIHAATMVTAGVYMIARLSFLYMAGPQALMLVAGIGALTAIFAAAIGFAQTDIKKILAYSTVSQLGFMFVGVGTGAFTAGVFHLFTHAWFKAGLFLGAGSVMHAMSNSTDIMKMGGLRKKTPITHAVFLVYCLAITGIPPFAGFFSKDEILAAAFSADLPGWPLWYGKFLWLILSAAALGTAFYMWRLYFLVFWGTNRSDPETREHIHESPRVMTVPLIILAAGASVLGFIGIPSVFGVPSFIAEWLEFPEHEVGAGTTWILMFIATALGVAGIAAAYALYKDGPDGAKKITRRIPELLKLAKNKFYVDEIYDAIIVKPFKLLVDAIFNVVDRFIIDKVLVGGWAALVSVVGRLVRAWQNGDVQRYLTAMLVGLAVIVWFATRSSAEFTARAVGTTWSTSRPTWGTGARPAASQRADWDFDGDGHIDKTGQSVSWDFRQPGEYDVVLHLTDAFGHERKVEHKINIRGTQASGALRRPRPGKRPRRRPGLGQVPEEQTQDNGRHAHARR